MRTRLPLAGAKIVLRIHAALLSLPFLLFLPPEISHAQVYDFKSYTVREGLLSNAITSLCQDSYGYLWVGTSDGLSVYDGETFRNYTVADGLASSLVNCVIEDDDHNGEIWAATNGGGLSRFQSGRFQTIKIGNSDWSNRVNSIAQDASGNLYCATDDGIYKVLDGVSSPISPRFAHGSYERVVCRGDSLFIVGEDARGFILNISRDSIGNFSELPYRQETVSRFCDDSENEIWFVSPAGDLENFTTGMKFRGIVKPYPQFLLDDGAGKIWIGTTQGLFELDKDAIERQPEFISTRNGLPSNDVTAGLVDREGDLWFGTSGKGLVKLSDRNSFEVPANFGTYPINNSQATVDARGHIWVTTRDGLMEIYSKPFSLPMWSIHTYSSLGLDSLCASVQVVRGDQMWVASIHGMLYEFLISGNSTGPAVLHKTKTYFVGKAFTGRDLLCLYVDKFGKAWCSRDLGGVLEFDTRFGPGSGKVYTTKDGLPDNSIRAIYRDAEGNVWFGGYIGGLAELKKDGTPGNMTLYTTVNGLPDNSVRAIVEDDSGNIWVGTRYGGVAVKTRSGFILISVKDGLRSNGVWAMSFSNRYGILFGTQLGLQQLDKGDWRAGDWRSFGNSIPVFSCGIAASIIRRRRADLLWASNVSGIFVSDLSGPAAPRVPPSVYITGLSVNGKEHDLSSAESHSSLRLQYSENTLTFVFFGVSLRDEGSLRYRYRLQGVDAGWRVLMRRLPVIYATLRPGSYSFEVKAVNSSGIESRTIATLPFVIVPPFWQRWWFLLISGIALFSVVYLSVRSRLSSLLEIERVRAKIATDLHDDIGSGLTRIAILADVALRKAEAEGKSESSASERITDAGGDAFSTFSLVNKIGTNARELVDSMSDVVWSIDPKNMTVRDLITRFRTFANETCEAKGISLNINMDRELETLRLDPGVMRALLLIAKEALNNSVKHSGCKRIKVSLKAGLRNLHFLITDDGMGFLPDAQTPGHGLGNMRKRASELGGKFSLKVAPGRGTVIEVTVPVSL